MPHAGLNVMNGWSGMELNHLLDLNAMLRNFVGPTFEISSSPQLEPFLFASGGTDDLESFNLFQSLHVLAARGPWCNICGVFLTA